MDRAEAKGFGVALAGHGALLAALSLGVANIRQPPLMNDPMEVSFVDEVGLTSAAPSIVPPAATVAPEFGPPEDPAPQPVVEPAPSIPAPPIPQPPVPAPEPVKPVPAKPAPSKAQPKAAPAKPQPAKTASGSGKAEQARGRQLGSDFLKGLGSDPAAKAQQPSGAVMSALAMAGIVAAIKRQIQPCADRQVDPGPGANRIEVKLNLRLNRDGSLAQRPRVVSTSGVDDQNERYEKRVTDLAIAAFTGCAPLQGLPEELYQTPKGGWSNFNMNYKLPG